jgi:hypothetical protein
MRQKRKLQASETPANNRISILAPWDQCKIERETLLLIFGINRFLLYPAGAIGVESFSTIFWTKQKQAEHSS